MEAKWDFVAARITYLSVEFRIQKPFCNILLQNAATISNSATFHAHLCRTWFFCRFFCCVCSLVMDEVIPVRNAACQIVLGLTSNPKILSMSPLRSIKVGKR